MTALDALERVAAQIATLPSFTLRSDPEEEALVSREAVWGVVTDAIREALEAPHAMETTRGE